MYKTSGKFWGRNRSLAKRAIGAASVGPKLRGLLKGEAKQPKSRARRKKIRAVRRADKIDINTLSSNDWRTRMEVHLTRWRSLLERKLGIIARLEETIAETEEMIRYGRDLGYDDNDTRSLDEKRKKLKRYHESVLRLEDKIASVSNELELDKHSRSRLAMCKSVPTREVEADVRDTRILVGRLKRKGSIRPQISLGPAPASSAALQHGIRHANPGRGNGDKKRRKEPKHSDLPPIGGANSDLPESGRPWCEVGGGLYGLGKNRKH